MLTLYFVALSCCIPFDFLSPLFETFVSRWSSTLLQAVRRPAMTMFRSLTRCLPPNFSLSQSRSGGLSTVRSTATTGASYSILPSFSLCVSTWVKAEPGVVGAVAKNVLIPSRCKIALFLWKGSLVLIRMFRISLNVLQNVLALMTIPSGLTSSSGTSMDQVRFFESNYLLVYFVDCC